MLVLTKRCMSGFRDAILFLNLFSFINSFIIKGWAWILLTPCASARCSCCVCGDEAAHRLSVGKAGGQFGLQDLLLCSLHQLVAAVAAPHIHLARLRHHRGFARLDAVWADAGARVVRRHSTHLGEWGHSVLDAPLCLLHQHLVFCFVLFCSAFLNCYCVTRLCFLLTCTFH